MLATKTLTTAMLNLLKADTATLAPAAALKCHLVKEPFDLDPDLVVADLTFATFPGYAALALATGAGDVYTDPLTGLQTLLLPDPEGGYLWVATGATDPVQTIYGYALTDNGGTALYGVGVLPAPVQIRNAGDGVNLGSLTFALSQFPLV